MNLFNGEPDSIDFAEPKPPAAFPEWFTAGKNTPRIHIANVQRGLHPMGVPLADKPGATCGNCRYLCVKQMGGRYLKCGMFKITAGPATDVRAKWRGCEEWAERTD